MLSPLVKVELETHIWLLIAWKSTVADGYNMLNVALFIHTSIIYSRDYRNLQTGFSPIALEPPWTLAAKQQSNTPVWRGDLETFVCPDVVLMEYNSGATSEQYVRSS